MVRPLRLGIGHPPNAGPPHHGKVDSRRQLCNIACDIIQFGMRLVLDTDVLVAAFRSERGASRELLIAGIDERYVLLASTALWLEYEAVLLRPLHLKAMRLSSVDVRDVLAALALIAEPVPIHFLWRPVLADAEDEHVLDLAMNGRADMLVTFNQVDFVEASRTFQIEVVTPAAALRRVR